MHSLVGLSGPSYISPWTMVPFKLSLNHENSEPPGAKTCRSHGHYDAVTLIPLLPCPTPPAVVSESVCGCWRVFG